MAVKTTTRFDFESLQRGYDEWDVDALLDLYAGDVELIQIDRDNPPGAPRVCRGKEVFKGMFEHCAAAGVRARVESPVAGEGRAAAKIICEFPGGRTVVANSILELEDGRIVRERDVQVGDPRL